MQKQKLENEVIEFLKHSNYIEGEYSKRGLEDAKKAWVYAVKNRDNFTVDYILEIHKILMKRLRPDIAGKVRDCAVSIAGQIKLKLPEKELIKKLDDWIKSCAPDEKETYETIKEQHVAFEGLHPFTDGNGRVGRILMNIQCTNAGLLIIVIHEGKEQYEYYKWFKEEIIEDIVNNF